MHFYIIDPSGVDDKTFVQLQSQLLATLTELRIPGEYARTTPLRSVASLVEQARNLEARTIVAVGNDETLQEVASAAWSLDVAVGYIPFSPSPLSAILGIPEDFSEACHTIAARRLVSLDVGKLNGSLFLSSVALGARSSLELPSRGPGRTLRNLKALWSYKPQRLQLKIDERFSVSLDVLLGLVVNARTKACPSNRIQVIGNPQDGFLDVLLIPMMSKTAILRSRRQLLSDCYEEVAGVSTFRARKIEILAPENYPLLLENKIVAKAPTAVSLADRKIKMIVGKNRQF